MGKLLLSPFVQATRFLDVLATGAPGLVFGHALARRFDHPTFTVGVSSRFVLSVLYMTRPLDYFVQRVMAIPISFKRLIFGSGPGVSDSNIDCHVIGFTTAMSTVFLIAP